MPFISSISSSTKSFSGLKRKTPQLRAEVLLVAGGGSSGTRRSTGAGAGGLLYFGANTNLTNANGSSRGINGPAFFANNGVTYTITVGAGGTSGGRGSNTSVTSPLYGTFADAWGGGGKDAPTGGSGAGGVNTGTGNSDNRQGNDGGNRSPSPSTESYAGGGGAGSVGGNPGTGGPGAGAGYGGYGLYLGDFSGYGTDSSNSPAPATGKGWFAGGGGGGNWGSYPAGGGTSLGGGGGGSGGKPAIAGLTNTGGGSGGGNDLLENLPDSPPVPNVTQNGGSGICLIAYPGPPAARGGTVDTTSRPGWTIHAFTSTGTFVFDS